MYCLEVIRSRNAKRQPKVVPFNQAHARVYADENGGAVLYPPGKDSVYLYPRIAKKFFSAWYAAESTEKRDDVFARFAVRAARQSVNRRRAA